MFLYALSRRTIAFWLVLFSLLFSPLALADASTKQANLATGVKLKYVESGPRHAPAIIFLHGATDSSHSLRE